MNIRFMYKTILTILLGLILLATDGFCQKGPARYLGEPLLTDTLSTLFIPVRYNEEFFSSNKIAAWGDYYANMLAYNFKTDTYKRLFDKDTFIEAFSNQGLSYVNRTGGNKSRNITSEWVFLLVKTKDTNNSGRIDEKDPSVLFAVSPDGETLKQLTDETENVASFSSFDKQGFILIKMQRDSNNDKSFKNEDKDFYYKKVNLTGLSLGKEIELK